MDNIVPIWRWSYIAGQYRLPSQMKHSPRKQIKNGSDYMAKQFVMRPIYGDGIGVGVRSGDDSVNPNSNLPTLRQ